MSSLLIRVFFDMKFTITSEAVSYEACQFSVIITYFVVTILFSSVLNTMASV